MRETKRTVWLDERVAGSGRGLDPPGDQGSPNTRRSREIRLFHVWLILAGKVNECNCTGTSFLLLPFSSSSSFSSYFPTPTLSFFSRAPIVALTYHTHAYRIEKRLEVTLPFFSFFFSLSFFFFSFFDCTVRCLVPLSEMSLSFSSDENLVIFAELRITL